MGSFLQYNPSLNNAESDALYLADSLRLGGAPQDSILPSLFWNKAAYQWATFIAAFAVMMANKGLAINDGGGTTPGFNALVAQLTNIKTSADFPSSIITLSYSASMIFNAASSEGWFTTLTGNVTASQLQNANVGNFLTFVIAQDAVGSRTFAWPSTFSGGAATSFTGGGKVCPLPNSISVQQFVVLPSGAVIPLGSIVWLTSAGIFAPPNIGIFAGLTTSGNISNAYPEIIEEVNCSGGSVTRTLPSAVGIPGFKVTEVKTDTSVNTLTVAAQSGQYIQTAYPNFVLNKGYNSLVLISDGMGWIIQ